ncbi:globin domain-containing protein [Streptomyces sp. G45]|uniref:globin domain-containing protein n=1 Tax=Streptomyces sp. G45 TaxID=3406627 RepID=UPI003C18E43F
MTPDPASDQYSDQYEEYRALLSRQEAMRLRQRLLAPTAAQGPADTAYADGLGEPDAPGGPGAPGAPGGPADDHRLITQTLHLVTPFDELITDLYAALFAEHPYLRGLFPESMAFQQAHLERAFRYLIDHLDRPDEVTAFCTRLGRDHRKLGVRPVHYEVFETALVTALRHRGGAWWPADAEEAWRRMLRRAVAAMVRGAERALAERPFWDVTVTAHQLRGPDLAVLRVAPAEPYPYRAGQYALLQSPLLPRAWRPFSVACAPRRDGELEFHVRRTGRGGVSDALVTGTGVGDALRLGPAQGAMTLADGDLGDDVLIVAGGTGRAGAKALVEDLARRRLPGREARLLLCGPPYAPGADAEWEARWPWLRTLSLADETAVLTALPHPPRATVLVSGALPATVRHLTALGLPADRVRHDLTGLPDACPPVARRPGA